MSDSKQQFVLYRIERAREALDDAGFLLQSGRLTGASNRVYYAMFYAASALLATRDLSASRHSGVIALFNDHFVKTGLFPRDLARHFGRAFEARMDTDYRVFATPDADEVRESLEYARAFISRTEDLLKPAEGG